MSTQQKFSKRSAKADFIRPRDSGGGGPPRRGGGGGAGLNAPQEFWGHPNIFARSLLRAKKTLCNDNEAPRPAPPPPRFARYASSSGPPPPLSRGRKARAISFSRRTRVRGLSKRKPRSFCLQKNKGRRSAEKAQLSRGASPRIGCCHPTALRARPRAERSALAFRRSTAALASAMCRSSIQAALHAMQRAGVSCAWASRLSEAPRAPVVMPAGSMPGPPESGSDEPPPAGTAPAPSVGVTG